MKGTMKLADHAELWWKKQGKELPARGTPEWQTMYETRANWAFSDLREEIKPATDTGTEDSADAGQT
jgi:hypothetical protein